MTKGAIIGIYGRISGNFEKMSDELLKYYTENRSAKGVRYVRVFIAVFPLRKCSRWDFIARGSD